MAKSFSNQENFYKRLRELSNVDAPTKSVSLDRQNLIEYTRATDGSALGIVKEDTSFYIKSSNTKGDLLVEHFTYIGGLENKLKYKYETLGEAIKVKNYYVSALNESLERKFNPAKTLNEEKELVAKSNADKGEVATAQDKADKSAKGAALKPAAQQHEPDAVHSKEGIANAQSEADKKKSDDASEKLKKHHEPSTATGKARPDIAKAQDNADAQAKGEALKKSAKEKEMPVVGKSGGEDKAQAEADKKKKEEKNKVEGHKEVKPASDAKKEKAIVAEHFGEEPAAEEEPVAADAAGAEASPVGGDETADLDAAASALDSLDINPDSANVNTGGAEEMPVAGADGVADQGSAEVPDAEAVDGSAEIGGNDTGNDEGALKDVEKLVGKLGQKFRSMDITPEMAGGFLKSITKSLEGSLADMDSDEKREISNMILKAGEEGEESSGSPESASPVAGSSGVEDDHENSPSAEAGAENDHEEKEVDENGMPVPADEEIEEAINQHLAEMGKADEAGVPNIGAGAAGAVPPKGEQPAMGASQHPNSFKKYMAERGYTGDANENVSIMEMVSLVNGYANECQGMTENADMQAIAEYMSPEVKKGVTECGYGNFAEGVEVFSIKPKAYKAETPIVEMTQEEEEEDESKKVEENWHKKDVVDPKKKGMFKGKTKEELHKELAHAKERGDTTKEKEINFALRAKNNWGKANEEEEKDESKKLDEYGNEHPISVEDALNNKMNEWNFDKKKGEDKEEKKEDKKKEFGFAKHASLNKAEKEEKEKKEEKKEEVSESAKAKLRTIIGIKIQEQLGLKKPSLNESKKSAFSKKLDEMVSAEIKKNKDFIKKYTAK